MSNEMPITSTTTPGTKSHTITPFNFNDLAASTKNKIPLNEPSNVEPKKVVRGEMVMPLSEANIYDIGRYINSASPLSNYDKLRLIENIWKPSSAYNFPVTLEGKEGNRKEKKFLPKWLTEYTWLAYSELYDGAFCLPCILFGADTGHNSKRLERLYTKPLISWTNAHQRFTEHCKKECQMHTHAVPAMQSFIDVMKGHQQSVKDIVISRRKELIEKNRRKLRSIVETVILCGRQTLAFRGHRDDETCPIGESNRGNFQALLDFRVLSGDTVLKEHFETAPRNATYRSKTIQNDLIDCCGEVLRIDIVEEVKEAGIYSLMADESPDISKKEQMPVSLRYVNKQGEILEEFLKFVHCENGTSAEAITEGITNLVQEVGLDIQNVRGQGYDGASNMSGEVTGVARRITDINPLAIYVHCGSHRLNLCVAAACSTQYIKK